MTPRLPSGRRPAVLAPPVVSYLVVTAALALSPTPGPSRAADEPPKPSAGASALPPLEIDTDAKLPDAPTPTPAPAPKPGTKAVADNSSCFVCHTNYKAESLASTHARHGVGCVRCHGASEAHRNDENNVTPPDKMIPLAKLDAGCKLCHTRHNVPARAVVARFLEKQIAAESPDSLVCTGCHGEHRLPRRTVVWDRATGKLLDRKASAAK